METDRREQPQRSRLIGDPCPGRSAARSCRAAGPAPTPIEGTRARNQMLPGPGSAACRKRFAAAGERVDLTLSGAGRRGRRGRRAVPARAVRAAGRTPVSPAVPERALRREDAADLPEARARALRAARGPGAVDRASGRVSALRGSRLRRRAKRQPWSGVPRQRRQHAREPIRGAGVSRQMGGVPWPHMRPTCPDLTPSNSP
jgi:hypothetical protein